MLTFTRTRGAIVINGITTQTVRELAHYVAEVFGFLMARGETCTPGQFAAVITQHYDNPKADAVAAELRALEGGELR